MFSKLLIWLIVFFLPSQLGLHFWPSFSRAAGIRLDYLSPTLYFVDLLLLVFVISTARPLLLQGVGEGAGHHDVAGGIGPAEQRGIADENSGCRNHGARPRSARAGGFVVHG